MYFPKNLCKYYHMKEIEYKMVETKTFSYFLFHTDLHKCMIVKSQPETKNFDYTSLY